MGYIICLDFEIQKIPDDFITEDGQEPARLILSKTAEEEEKPMMEDDQDILQIYLGEEEEVEEDVSTTKQEEGMEMNPTVMEGDDGNGNPITPALDSGIPIPTSETINGDSTADKLTSSATIDPSTGTKVEDTNTLPVNETQDMNSCLTNELQEVTAVPSNQNVEEISPETAHNDSSLPAHVTENLNEISSPVENHDHNQNVGESGPTVEGAHNENGEILQLNKTGIPIDHAVHDPVVEKIHDVKMQSATSNLVVGSADVPQTHDVEMEDTTLNTVQIPVGEQTINNTNEEIPVGEQTHDTNGDGEQIQNTNAEMGVANTVDVPVGEQIYNANGEVGTDGTVNVPVEEQGNNLRVESNTLNDAASARIEEQDVQHCVTEAAPNVTEEQGNQTIGEANEPDTSVAVPDEPSHVNAEINAPTSMPTQEKQSLNSTTQSELTKDRPKTKKRKYTTVVVEWEERVLELIQYKLRKGNCNIPVKWKPNGGKQLMAHLFFYVSLYVKI